MLSRVLGGIPMKWNQMIPEFDVFSLDETLHFYVDLIGFKVVYDRPEDKFAFIEMEDVQIMVQEIDPTSNKWDTGTLDYPLGRGINFQIDVKNIDEIYNSMDAIYTVLVKTNIMLHNGSFFNELVDEYTDKDIDLMKNSNILAVQAAAWLAIVFSGEKKDFHTFDNVFKKYNINDNQQINEFLGHRI